MSSDARKWSLITGIVVALVGGIGVAVFNRALSDRDSLVETRAVQPTITSELEKIRGDLGEVRKDVKELNRAVSSLEVRLLEHVAAPQHAGGAKTAEAIEDIQRQLRAIAARLP